jgi:hypothetical protein
MNCNKIKTLKIKEADVVEALKDSAEVEVSADHKKLRRKGDKPVPELDKKEQAGLKRRDAKAASKEESKKD